MREAFHQTYSFDGFTLDLTRGSLLRGEEEIRLRPKSYTALKFLVENSGRLVTKDELVEAVWSDTAVTDNSLVQCMKEVRVALGDHSQRYIRTVPRRGYIFEERVTSNTAPETLYIEEVEELHLVVEEQSDDHHAAGTEKIRERNDAMQITGRRPRMGFLAPSIIVIVAVAILGYYLISTRTPTVAVSGVRSIAILPFKPLDGAEGDVYLGLGIADALITRLGRTKEIAVRPTSSIQKYTSHDQDTLAAGKEQRVDAVLEGSMQRQGERIRVTARLINTADGSILWAYKGDESFTDIFALEDAISEKLASTLVRADDKAWFSKRYTDNAEAYQLCLRGRFYWERATKEDLLKALAYFDQAIRVDPNYALAYAGIAHCYGPLGYQGYLPPREAMLKMRAAAEKAVELDNTSAEGYTALGAVKAFYEWDWAGAETEFQRAIELNPNFTTAHAWYGLYLEALGRHEESIAARTRACEIDPLNVKLSQNLGTAFYHARNYDRAIEIYRKALESEPNFFMPHQGLGAAYKQMGRYEEAARELQKAIGLPGNTARSKAYLASVYAAAGRNAEAHMIEKELRELARSHYVSSFDIALIHTELGDSDRAFEWLEKGYNEGDPQLNHLNVEPGFDNLRVDPRFQDLLKRMRLAR